jgi:hypothetical protein
MSDTESTPPAQKVTKDEIIAAINQICEKRGQPVVRLGDIADVDSIDVGKQAIKKHLDELQEMGRVHFLEYGQAGVWWTPEGVDTDSEIDGVIDWDAVDADEIPLDILAEFPEFQEQTYWEGARDTWGTVSVGAFFLVFVTALVEIFRQNTPVQLGPSAQDFMSVVAVGGLSVAVLSLGLVFAMRLMQWLEVQGILDVPRQSYRTVKHSAVRAIQDRLPDLDS